MKLKKIMHSLVLFSMTLGTLAPAVVQATETSSTTDASSSVSSSSSVEPSTSSSIEPSTSSSVEPSSSSTTDDASSSSSSTSSEEPSTSTSQEDSSSQTTSTSSSSTSSSSLTEAAGTTTPELSASGLRPEAIVGDDDQNRVRNTTEFPYRTVVYLEMVYGNTVYRGSGVLIAPDLVLTVAHNVYNRETKKWADAVFAVPGKNGTSNPYGVFSSVKYYTLRSYKTASDTDDIKYDIAVIQLTRPVPSSVGYLPVSTATSIGDRIQLPGYPAYTESKIHYLHTSFGEVDDLSQDGTLIGYTLDAEQGNSGSPILNNRNQVIGVHSSGINVDGSDLYGLYNVARRVDNDVLKMIDVAKNNASETLLVSTNREVKTGVVYRLYNPQTKQYFYTKSLDEADILKSRGFNFEGRGFITADSGKSVYRLYHAGRKAYVYTTNVIERNKIVREGWKYEGVAWYSAGNTKVYRLFNPQAKVHMYTTIWKEVEILKGRGWKYEGVTFYTLP